MDKSITGAQPDERLIGGIWELFKEETQKYCAGESTSVTAEKAEALLESLLYTLSASGECLNAETEFSSALSRGRRLLQQKKEALKRDYVRMLNSLPEVTNAYYDDTIAALREFFLRYKPIYAAHEIPCSIDYWLLCRVPEELRGISYIEEYMRRLKTENVFLRTFDPVKLRMLYELAYGDYRSDFFNLCEPVLINAVGLSLLGGSADTVLLSSEQQAELAALFDGKTEDETAFLILAAAQELGYDGYFIEALQSLPRRVHEASLNGNMNNIFI